jgi:serine/threonine protein kinase
MRRPEAAATSDCPPEAAFVDLLDGRLADPDAAGVRRHAGQCRSCEALLDALTKGATTGAGATPPADTATDDQIAREILRGSATGAAPGSAGRTLDRKYALLHMLGKGGMGEVYEAEQVETGRRVAVKMIHRRLLDRGAEIESRFRREAKAAGATHSPHIVEVLDSGEDAETGDLYLVMEILRGDDLQHTVDRVGPLPPDVALRVAAQALVGLAKAHEAGVVHRDIKPANLFLARGDGGEVTVKLLDFGIAKVTSEALRAVLTSGLTRTDAMLGSPYYMSPEQMQNSKRVDHRADLWSLGSALYYALTGRPPFWHVENVFELLSAVRAGGAPEIRELAPWVPPEVAEAVRPALAFDPEARYPSAAAMLEALLALLPEGSGLRREMLAGVSPEARAAAVASLPPGPSRERERHVVDPGGDELVSGDEATLAPARRSNGRARFAALAVLLLGAGAGVIYKTLPVPVSHESAVPTPSATAPPIRRVRLLILPEDAAVEVDGASAEVREGGVEIGGVPGSGHRVRVSRDGAELSTDVFVTESGAVPPKLELAAPKPEADLPDAGAAHATTAGPRGASPMSGAVGPLPRRGSIASAAVSAPPPSPRDDDLIRKAE